jgi:dTDP-4-dehydrorhamnose reductase
VLITGGDGRVARELAPRFRQLGWDVWAPGHRHLDVTDADAVLSAVLSYRPHAAVNLAALTNIHACELSPDLAYAVNGHGVANLSRACLRTGTHLVTLSSDYVFNGHSTVPYRELDPVDPLSVYGASKLAGEIASGDGATVVRTAWLCGDHAPNAVHEVLAQAARPGHRLRFVDDQVGSPTSARDLVRLLVVLVQERRAGLFHVTNQGQGSWYDVARHVLTVAGHDPDRVEPITTAELAPVAVARRPAFSVLDNARLRDDSIDLLPDWRSSFEALVHRVAAASEPVEGATWAERC